MAENERILIIDDEPAFAESCRMTLQGRSYQVVCAREEEQARHELTTREPDIIILGTLASASQAFSFQQWVKQHPRYRGIPLLVIGGPETDQTRGWRKFEGMQMLAEDYLTKPVEPSVLLPRIQSLLEGAYRKIRVLVADDHTMVRDGICTVLSLQKDVDVVGEAMNGQEAFEKVVRLMPNVVLMDIVMPVMSGIEATKRIIRECPQTRILILTQYDEEENMVIARQAGAQGFIPKRAASADLVRGIKSVFAGDYFPQSFATVSSN